jgi:hypothetical protein
MSIDYATRSRLADKIKECVSIDVDDAIDVIQRSFSPDEIFEASELEEWAEDNGYVKEEDND